MASDDGVERELHLIVCADAESDDSPRCRSALWRRVGDGTDSLVIDGLGITTDGGGDIFDALYSSLDSDP